MIFWSGHCCVHNNLTLDLALKAKEEHPNAEFVVHPECLKEVVDIADFCGSTSKIIDYIKASKSKEFIIGTEEGILHKLKTDNPEKVFYLAHEDMICKNMKKIGLEDILESLENETYKIELNKEIIDQASKPLDRMLGL
jgi:quinolinate synthase